MVYPSFLPSSTAAASIFGRTTSRIGATHSDTIVHFLPSHCSNSTGPLPSWSSHVTFTACVKPFMPSSSSRLSVRFRFSKPQRICSVVGGLLPNFAMAVRIASTVNMALTMPRL